MSTHQHGFHLPALSRPRAVYSSNALSTTASDSAAHLGQPGPSLSNWARSARDSLHAGYSDFDDPHVYKAVYDYALDENALNFAVQLGDNKARVACGLGADEMQQLLQQPSKCLNDGTTPTRWIQRAVVEAIGEHYNFSRRLTMSIWAWDMVKTELIRRKAVTTAAAGFQEETMAMDGLEDVLAPENLATFKMMQDNLNYTSMDQETKFVCIGANWLHRRPAHETKKTTPSLVPPRHWSWFVLCDDYTVITFHEAAYYEAIPKEDGDSAMWRAEELRNMRSNTVKVLRQLSTCGLAEDRLKFMQLTSVRQPGRHLSDDAHRLEGSSNLFYYLFEDYSAAFGILDTSKTALENIVRTVSRVLSTHMLPIADTHQSSRILHTGDRDSSRGDMSDIIPLLYTFNKELRQLHHLFTNYRNGIGRLIGSQEKEVDGDGGGTSMRERLSGKAINRFRRLQSQMQSLMLDAIADCLDETRSLQDTDFNLITQKDSHATERLTRSATLLAKLSVFFLPISFMTSYFSVQIPHMSDNYTARTYWCAFAVIASVSFLSLFFFGKMLMFISERIDQASDQAARWAYGRMGGVQRRQKRAMQEEAGVYM